MPSGPNTTGTPIQDGYFRVGARFITLPFKSATSMPSVRGCGRLQSELVLDRAVDGVRPAGELHSSFLLRLSGRNGGDSVLLAGAPSPNRLPTGTRIHARRNRRTVAAVNSVPPWAFSRSSGKRKAVPPPLRLSLHALSACEGSFLSGHAALPSCVFVIEPVLPLLRAMAFLGGIDLDVQIGSFNAYSQEILDERSSLYTFVRTSSFSPRLQPMSLLIFGNVLQTFRALRKKSRQLRFPTGSDQRLSRAKLRSACRSQLRDPFVPGNWGSRCQGDFGRSAAIRAVTMR